MEAALLMFDVVGVTIVLVWAGRGTGLSGLLAWRPDPQPKTKRER